MTIIEKHVERFFQFWIQRLIKSSAGSDQPRFALGEFLLPDTHWTTLFGVELFDHSQLVARPPVGREMDLVHKITNEMEA